MLSPRTGRQRGSPRARPGAASTSRAPERTRSSASTSAHPSTSPLNTPPWWHQAPLDQGVRRWRPRPPPGLPPRPRSLPRRGRAHRLPCLFPRPSRPHATVQIVILTLFPEALEPYLRASILGVAQAKGKVRLETIDFRDFTRDRHRTVDDRPYGGGPGMVLKPEPV